MNAKNSQFIMVILVFIIIYLNNIFQIKLSFDFTLLPFWLRYGTTIIFSAADLAPPCGCCIVQLGEWKA